ncbi:MAG: hypothetical protein IPL96_17370 [Holophagaceae bacterium]|nr:hypothetical protein [Holophagaceae bacterium]
MDVQVDQIEIQELHQYSPGFVRSDFDTVRLADFLNSNTTDDSKWVSAKARTEDERLNQVILENSKISDENPLLINKIIIDNDSILIIAKMEGRILTESDEVYQVWPRIIPYYELLIKHFRLPDDFFANTNNRDLDIYRTRTLGAKINCKLERFLHPKLMELLNGPVRSAYLDRLLDVVFHPYNIACKVNTSPTTQVMSTLPPLRFKSMISRDDLDIFVQQFQDYEGMIITLGSQMPFHSHVKTLRSLADIAESFNLSS